MLGVAIDKTLNKFNFYSNYRTNKNAAQLSSSIKRLDVVAAQMGHLLSLCKNITLKNKMCCEIGGGWIFSHAIVMYLLGAKHILITDIEPLGRPEYIKQAINNSSISIVRDILSPYEDHSILREKLNILLNIKKFNYKVLEKLNIEYKTPMSLDKEVIPSKFDFIFSNVVLEYFLEDSLRNLFQNLKNMINSSGQMIHTIHLEDHRSNNPFAYLETDPDFYKSEKYKINSNRIRFSNYDKIIKQSGWEYEYLYKWQRKDAELPNNIDKDLLFVDEDDLRISHFCVHMRLK